jgi:hypothetical protein
VLFRSIAISQTVVQQPYDAQVARHVQFFMVSMPDMLLTAMLAAGAAVWAYRGALRRFTREREPLYSGGALVGLMATWLFCVLGFYWQVIAEGNLHHLGNMWCVASLPLFMLPIGAMRDRDDYIEETRRVPANLPRMIMRSNLSVLLPPLLLWLAFIAATAIAAPALRPVLCYTAVNVATSWLFLVFLLEIHVLYSGGNDRLSMLVAAVALLFLVLPPAIAMTLKNAALAAFVSSFSILGFWINFDVRVLAGSKGNWTTVCSNLVLCSLAILPILRRYRQILSWRAAMSRG